MTVLNISGDCPQYFEEGCAEFSNITGLTQIRFPKGNIMAKSEDIRQVLEREGIV